MLAYKGNRPSDCLTTGEAAAMLGYSVRGFQAKFEAALTVYRDGSGWRGWLRSEVEALVDPIAS